MERDWRSAVWLCGVGRIVDLRVKNGSDGRDPFFGADFGWSWRAAPVAA
jgi:hypothetical protein